MAPAKRGANGINVIAHPLAPRFAGAAAAVLFGVMLGCSGPALFPQQNIPPAPLVVSGDVRPLRPTPMSLRRRPAPARLTR